MGKAPRYAMKGRRQGFEIKPSDHVTVEGDGYSTVRRDGRVVGVYLTALLTGGTHA